MWPRFLSSSYPLDEHYFAVSRFSLTLLGFYPEQKRSWAVRAWSFFNFSILVYGCYAEASYGIHQIPINIGLALDALCPVATSILSLIKMCSVWYYRDELKSLIERVRQLTEEQNSERKVGYKRSYYTMATRLTALLLWCSFLTSTAYTVRHIFDNVLRLSHGMDWLYETPFKMIFPDAFLRQPLYPLVYTLVCWHGYITVTSFSGADGFFFGFCLYLAVLLQSLRDDVNDLLHLDSRAIEVGPTPQEEKRIEREMVKLINRHNEISDLTDRLSGVMVEITLAHFVTSSLVIGTSILDMLMFSGVGVIIYLVYTVSVTIEIFLYCLGGTYIMEACLDLARSTFGSHWYGHSVPVQKMTLLMIARAQRVLVVKIPFFSPTMETFTSVGIRFCALRARLLRWLNQLYRRILGPYINLTIKQLKLYRNMLFRNWK